MGNSIKIGIGIGIAWCVVKYVAFLVEPLPENILPTVMLNILFLLSSVALALYLEKRYAQEETSALGDIKNAMKAAIPYTLVVSVFIYFFYAEINPAYNEHQISEAVTFLEKSLNDPVELQKLRESNASFEVMTKEEIFTKMKTNPEGFYNAKSTMTLSLLAMLLLSTLYSILVTVIYRKVVFKN